MAQGNEMLSAAPIEGTPFPSTADAPAAPARADQARRLTTLRVGIITISGRRQLCLIRNVSAGGLRAHVYSALAPGQRVSVELKTDQQTGGTVSWVDGGTVGVSFDEEIDVEDLLAAPNEGAAQPRMPRVEVDSLGELRIGGRIFPINTCDMSQGGALVEIDHPLQAGQNVVLTLEKFRPVKGVVRWYQDGRGGIAFNQVIPFHELVNWLRRH